MGVLIAVVVIVVLLALLGFGLSVRIVKQYEQGVLFRLGRLQGPRAPGFNLIIPVVDVLRRVSLRVVTMPIQSQGIITRDNVSVDVSAVAYYKVVDAVKSVVAIENVRDAIDQIAQTTLRKVVGQHTLDQTLSETDQINLDIRKILEVTTAEWGVEVTLVELKDIQLPDSMKRAMARQAEAEREKRAKIINAEGESLAAAALGEASDTMMAHPLALQLRNLQSLVEIGVDKNTTVVFPAPLMSTIAELGSFLATEQAAATRALPPSSDTNSRRRRPAEPPMQRHKGCSHVTDTPAAALLRRMVIRHDHEGTPEMNARPNIVLIHGAWADGSCWSGVIERLQADGYHVTAPQFPLTALADDVARLRQVLDLPGRPRHRRRALLRRPGHDRPGRGRPERRRPGLHRRVRA